MLSKSKILFSKLLFFFSICFVFSLNAQVSDDFTDGDYTNNPTWNGDSQYFIVDNQKLRSNGPSSNGSSVADTIYLSLPINQSMNAFEWKLLIDLKFNPTSSNFVRFYLHSDQPDLKKCSQAYYAEIGRSTSDSVKFYKQHSGAKELLFVGNKSYSGNIKVNLWIKRDSSGTWTVLTDESGGTNYSLEGLAFKDTSYNILNYSGIFCEYKTDSRFDQFYFDDFFAGAIIPDNSPPLLSQLEITSPNILDLFFSEEIDTTTAQDISNYSVDQGIGHPVIAISNPMNLRHIQLMLSNNLTIDQPYILHITSLKDQNGNVLVDTNVSLIYHQALAYDIVISEIMTDENPVPNYLPERDYVEIYNRSNSAIDLTNWALILNGNNRRAFSKPYTLNSNNYLILCHEDDESIFSNYGDTYGFSSFSINNEGSVSLKNQYEQIVHQVDFTKSWYEDDIKSDGGWSIEMIDTDNPCTGFGNWSASKDNKGGSPGEANSVQENNPDNVIPEILRIEAENPQNLIVIFNETIDSLQLLDAQNYQIGGGIGFPIIAKAIAPVYDRVKLQLGTPLQPDSTYSLILVNGVNDCSGNLSDCCIEQKFGIPQNADTNDLIINEVLFNPLSSGVDFVEIYNRSDKIIDISNYYLAGIDAVLGSIDQVSSILDHQHQMFPGEYLLLTTEIEKVKTQYFVKDLDVMVEMIKFPSLSNDKGSVLIVDQALESIDRLDYYEEMHFGLLSSVEGVSLERIGFDRPTTDITNWHSAAESAGFGTPGYFNSQSLNPGISQAIISVNPDVFSPDNDGFDDVVNFQYQLEDHGNMMNVRIFDSRGRMIKFLVNNEQISPSGIVSWDGIDDKGMKSNTGIYLVVFDILNINGIRTEYRKSFVLASRLSN